MTKYSGFVDVISRDGIAFVTLHDEQGKEIDMEFPVNEDLRERRRFILTFETVPDKEITPEFEKQVDEKLKGLIDGEEENGN